jgi:hypothetical protein
VARHGDVAVELDALPVAVLRARIVRALEETRRLEREDRERLNSILGG